MGGVEAAGDDVAVGMAGVVVVDRDPIEPGAEVALHLPHQVAGDAAEVGDVGGILGRDGVIVERAKGARLGGRRAAPRPWLRGKLRSRRRIVTDIRARSGRRPIGSAEGKKRAFRPPDLRRSSPAEEEPRHSNYRHRLAGATAFKCPWSGL